MPVLTLLLFLFAWQLPAQSDLYFPPSENAGWESLDPAELNWCPEKLDSLQLFLEEHNSRSFVLLYQGRIVLEYYFDGADAESFWYLASAGKSVMGFLMGMAQEEGLLDIDDPVSNYLGNGWTVAPPEKEDLITIWHQLTMTSGLDDMPDVPGEPDPQNCLDPECLQYLEDAGTRWAYHNAPYRLTQEVVAAASGQTINQFTITHLNERLNTEFFWLAHICWGRALDAARFGLLILNEGVWDTDTLLADSDYFSAMVTTSQDLNESYGYLWWLNGKSSFMVPTLQTVFPGPLFPDAPADMIAALGLNDQKIYVVPSLDMVVVRQGDAANEVVAGPSSFDNQLWQMILHLECTTSATGAGATEPWMVYPQPATNSLFVSGPEVIQTLRLLDMQGKSLRLTEGNEMETSGLASGVYVLEIRTGSGFSYQKVIIQ